MSVCGGRGCTETTGRVQCPARAVTALRPEGTSEGAGQVERAALERGTVASVDRRRQPNMTLGAGGS